MNLRKFKLFPEEELLTIPELEKRLSYRHLPLNVHEDDLKLKGEQSNPSHLAKRLGRKYHKKILNSYIPDVSIRFVHPSVGYGLFAEKPLKKEQYVGEYTGIVRRNDRRYFEPINNYCYEYPVPDEIGRNYVIDATSGCLTRFINHSSKPNLKPLHVYWEGFYHLIFLSLHEIASGEQLSFDYGESYWYIREKPVDL